MSAPGFSLPPIRVLLFARYAELLGTERLELAPETIHTAGDVLDRVRAMPGGARIGEGALLAINLRQASAVTPVAPGDEVAVLPPLAGG